MLEFSQLFILRSNEYEKKHNSTIGSLWRLLVGLNAHAMLVYKQILTSRIVILLNGQPSLLDFCMCNCSTIKVLLNQNCNEELTPQAYPSAYGFCSGTICRLLLRMELFFIVHTCLCKRNENMQKKRLILILQKKKMLLHINTGSILNLWDISFVLSLAWILYSASNIWFLFWQMEVFKCLVQC